MSWIIFLDARKSMDQRFWLEDPSTLIKSFHLLPDERAGRIERLNSLSLLIIIISLVLFLLKVRYWWVFLIGGLLVTIVLWKSEQIQCYQEIMFVTRPQYQRVLRRYET